MGSINNNKKDNAEKNTHRDIIKQEAGRLADMLENSPEYRRFVIARDNLDADEEQKNLLMELRQQQMMMSISAMTGEEMEDAAVSVVSDMYASLINNKVINDYLFAEWSLFRLISEVEQIFSGRLDLWQEHTIEVSDKSISHLN